MSEPEIPGSNSHRFSCCLAFGCAGCLTVLLALLLVAAAIFIAGYSVLSFISTLLFGAA